MSILKANRIENLTTTDGGINVNNQGRVGIGGVTSPFDMLHVKAATDCNYNFSSAGGTEASLEIFNDAGTSNTPLNIRASVYKFKVQSTEKCRITSDGLTFNGDTAAINALSDYEEGTWTPAISNTGYTFTYSVQNGQYTKIGRLVTLRFRIVVTARSGSASGGHPIINLPITSDGSMDGGNFRYVMPSELVVHKVGTTTSSGAKTLLFGGFGNGNRNNFWVNNPTVTNTNPFDLGSDFNLGGVITYTV